MSAADSAAAAAAANQSATKNNQINSSFTMRCKDIHRKSKTVQQSPSNENFPSRNCSTAPVRTQKGGCHVTWLRSSHTGTLPGRHPADSEDEWPWPQESAAAAAVAAAAAAAPSISDPFHSKTNQTQPLNYY